MISTDTADNSDSSDPDERSRHDVMILAAGRGTRMQSRIPKVLHLLAGLPLIEHVYRSVAATAPAKIITTIGPETDSVRDYLGDRVAYAWQAIADGTGGAVRAGLERVSEAAEWVVVVNADVPLLESPDLRRLVQIADQEQPLIAIMTFPMSNPGTYGRLLRGEDDRILKVVEAADDLDREIIPPGTAEINSGIYCFDAGWLAASIDNIPRSSTGEYYLTSLIEAAANSTERENPVIGVTGSADSLIGVDDRLRLSEAERTLRRRINQFWMRRGVTIVDPDTTYIDATVMMSQDARIEPGASLRGLTDIGESVTIGPGSMVVDSVIGARSIINHSWVESTHIGSDVKVGPFAHLRAGTIIDDQVHIGNYAETKNSRIGRGTKVPHFSYIGDATLGKNINIGAGTVTCNYDGTAKHETVIGSNAFIGSDTMLIAPVNVGEGGRTGAGSVVTRSVPPGKTVVGIPARQTISKTSVKPDDRNT